jgi:hypothetical protein
VQADVTDSNFSYQLGGVTQYCPAHYIKVSNHIIQIRSSLFVDEQRSIRLRGRRQVR